MALPHRNAVRTIAEAPIVQWGNGRTEARPLGAGRFTGFVGWFTEQGKDHDFDAWCHELNVAQVEIRHPRQGGTPAIVKHWSLGEALRVFPVTSGPVAPTVASSLAQRNVGSTVEAGIGIRWGRGEGERSKLAVRGYLQVDGALTPGLVQVSVRSRMTDELLAALVDHVRVCELADTLVDRVKHPDVVQCYELALTLGAGAEEAWGRGETTTVFPIKSQHPEAPALPYLRASWRPDAVVERALADWAGVQAWAQEFSFAAAGEPAQYEDAL